MTTFVALLRAVNLGGWNLLPMKDLAALCTGLGFADVRTYIQSGNVVLRSNLSEQRIRKVLEEVLTGRLGRPVDVMIRSASELRAVLAANPFPDAPPARVAVLFSSHPVPPSAVDDVIAPGGEQAVAGKREMYIFYPDGMGRSKLKLPPALGRTTARNINTVAKLVSIATSMR
jgi:uncharacterized protein (DUF1697 family)